MLSATAEQPMYVGTKPQITLTGRDRIGVQKGGPVPSHSKPFVKRQIRLESKNHLRCKGLPVQIAAKRPDQDFRPVREIIRIPRKGIRWNNRDIPYGRAPAVLVLKTWIEDTESLRNWNQGVSGTYATKRY
jgi:hypothetical protein